MRGWHNLILLTTPCSSLGISHRHIDLMTSNCASLLATPQRWRVVDQHPARLIGIVKDQH
jgi:hypothetical protein